MAQRKQNQTGSATLILFIILILASAGLTGVYVWQKNHKPKATTSSTAAQLATTASAFSVNTSKLPSGWKESIANEYAVNFDSSDKKCSVIVSKISDSAAKAENADSFTQQLSSKVGSTDTNGYTSTQTDATTLTVLTANGSKSLKAFNYISKDAHGQIVTYERNAYIVNDGNYFTFDENCINQSELTAANQAIAAVTVKE